MCICVCVCMCVCVSRTSLLSSTPLGYGILSGICIHTHTHTHICVSATHTTVSALLPRSGTELVYGDRVILGRAHHRNRTAPRLLVYRNHVTLAVLTRAASFAAKPCACLL